VITARELDQRVGLIARRLQQQKVPVPPPDELRSQVLNQMVVERIQLQKAKDDGIEVSDATVQSTLQRLAAANGMTVDQYRAQLEALGVPWSTFSGDARNELILSRLREKEVDSKITVTDAEVASYIASQRGPNSGSQQDVRLEHIFVAAPQNA
ncbi:SurA N-terminal domain-containing protein, partial [Burkholderia vietnamiensis]|uniref:SurA N-terminal domain-containing protein n=1 Tax=Burkholderia vietnamiensis TaxID=60552 RepID=UPI001593D396